MNSCQSIYQRQQLAGSNRPYEIDVSLLAVSEWTANASIPASSLIRPTVANETGFVYQSGSSGQTGPNEPAWSVGSGTTTPDGSINWTTFTPPAGGEDSIVSASWSQQSPPDGALTITGQTNTSLVASAYIGGGTSGNVYTILVSVTMASGAIYVAQIYLTIL